MVERRDGTKGKTGVKCASGRSMLVAKMEGMNGWDRVKTWLGGKKIEGVIEEEWEMLYREVAGFCRKVMDKRSRVVSEGHGSATAARIIYW